MKPHIKCRDKGFTKIHFDVNEKKLITKIQTVLTK